MVLKDKRDHCNLRPDFKKVKFDVRRSLEPSKDLDGCFKKAYGYVTQRYYYILNCVVNLLS